MAKLLIPAVAARLAFAAVLAAAPTPVAAAVVAPTFAAVLAPTFAAVFAAAAGAVAFTALLRLVLTPWSCALVALCQFARKFVAALTGRFAVALALVVGILSAVRAPAPAAALAAAEVR